MFSFLDRSIPYCVKKSLKLQIFLERSTCCGEIILIFLICPLYTFETYAVAREVSEAPLSPIIFTLGEII